MMPHKPLLTMSAIIVMHLLSIFVYKCLSQSYIDCTQMCNFQETQQIVANNPIQYISLPQIFQLTFEVRIAGNSNQYPILANILEIWSVTLKKSLVRISLEPLYNSNQITISYAGQKVFNYGPAITFSDTDFAWLTLTITERSLFFGTEKYSKSYPIPNGAIVSDKNILYASYIEDTTTFSSGGLIRNIIFQAITHSPTFSPTLVPTRRPSGPSRRPSRPPTFSPSVDALCCATNTYPMPTKTGNSSIVDLLQECPSATNPLLERTTSCSTCRSYQCIDWTMGSAGMQARERSFYRATGQRVYFAVGSFGNSSSLAGLCLRATVTGVNRDIIMQVIDKDASPAAPLSKVFYSPSSSPPPSSSSRTDMRVQMAGGGLTGSGINACAVGGAPSAVPQYFSDIESWGPLSGGWDFQSQCSNLPSYSYCGLQGAPISAQDALPSLCRWSFQQGVRKEPNPTTNSFTSYPAITKICAVACPTELRTATGLYRVNEPASSFTCPDSSATSNPLGDLLSIPGALSRKMDCGSPFYSSAANVLAGGGLTHVGYSSVVPCRRDGYVRITSEPTPPPSIMPSEAPTVRPTEIPTTEPTEEPTYTVTMKPSPKTRQPTANRTTIISIKASSQAHETANMITNPGVQAAMVVGFILIVFLALVTACEWSLRSQAHAAWETKKQKIRDDRRALVLASRAQGRGDVGDHYTTMAMLEELPEDDPRISGGVLGSMRRWIGSFLRRRREPPPEDLEIIA